MDASISHDPFAPDDVQAAEFRAARWTRVGATAEELAALQESFDAGHTTVRNAEARMIDKVADGELAQALERMRTTGDFAGFMASPAPEEAEAEGDPAGDAAPEGDQTPPAAPGDPAAVTGAQTPPEPDQSEQDAAHGPWEPAEQPLEVGGESYPAWNLLHGYVGTLVGDEANGVHLLRSNREELALAVAELLAEQAPPPAP